ncbi:MAG: hypothetical protein IJG33_14165 [Selenomonadaceae bacterium]|nr:hypothetical protein [Selenomonadaceae bacterium]
MTNNQMELVEKLFMRSSNVVRFGKWKMEEYLGVRANDTFYVARVRPNELSLNLRKTLEESLVPPKDNRRGRFMGYRALFFGFDDYQDGTRDNYEIVISEVAYESLYEENDEDDED